MMFRSICNTAIAGMGVAFLTACASTAPPAITPDGLELVPDSKFAEVYKKPGAELDGYTKFGLASCQVAFKKNWKRDQNNSRVDLSSRVTQEDMDKIKTNLGSACDDKFREALLEDPAYDVVDTFNEGEAVLILRPSIVNLDVNAPDVRSAGMSRTYTTSSGEMTLYLELLDATTGDIVARVIDRKRDMDSGHMQWSNSVTNKAEADRILRRWAGELREGLDHARQH